MTARVRLPRQLAELTAGVRELQVPAGSLTSVLDTLSAAHPVLVRRLRDETGALRRYVNVYVDGEDVRATGGLLTPVGDGCLVEVLPCVAGGALSPDVAPAAA